MLSEISKIDEYLTHYAKHLGAKSVETDRPLYTPGLDESLDFSRLLRSPKGAQANAVNALVRDWETQLALILCGEMGTGKTWMGAVAVHLHAKGRPYRACIMAPNHLIDKWSEEIEMTLPGVSVRTFEKSGDGYDDSYREVLAYADSCRGEDSVKVTKDGRQDRPRWSVPDRPEWCIIGRNQAKWEPKWEPMGKTPWVRNPGIFHDRIYKLTDRGGNPKSVKMSHLSCPKCGQIARNGDTVIDPKKFSSQVTCKTLYLVEVADEKRPATGLDVVIPLPDGVSKNSEVGRLLAYKGRTYRVAECGEPLWTWTPSPRKWAPAKIVQTKMDRLFDYFILDEMHEEKSASSAQALAACKIMTASKRVIGLTGTLIGGYAPHLFPLLMRMAPRTLIAEGFEWGGEMAFSKIYGRIDTTYTTTIGGGEGRSRGGKASGSTSMRKESDTSVNEDVKPGIVPTFFGRHLMDKTVFVTLEEMGDELPEIMDDDRSLVPCHMDDALAAEYKRVAGELVETNKMLVLKGSMKLMSCLQQTLLGYPDRPYGWRAPIEVSAYRPHAWACGYFEGEKAKAHYSDWVSVCQPADLDTGVLYPKEKALFDICHKEACEGRQTWDYVMQTGKRDIQGRLKAILESGGLKVGVLRQSTAEPRERMEWIKANGPKNHVIISHPQLVSTGLDFFDKKGSFNYCSLVFYQSTYDVNLMRQAGRRHWRVGQVKECRNFYLYYQQTMQHQAVNHIGEKYAAAKSLEGKFSAEGLAAMAEGGIGMTEMAAALSKKIEDPRGSWGKLRSDKPKPAVLDDDLLSLFASADIDDDTLALFAGVGAA